MFENLLELVKSNAGEAIINNAAVPNEKNEAVISHTSSSIMESLKGQLGAGNLSDVLNTLGGKAGLTNNPVVSQVISSVSGSLMSKFGLSADAAQSVTSSLVPSVMNQLVTKTNDPNDSSFDLGGILNSLSGGKTQGLDLSSLLSGNGDLKDLAGKISSGSNSGGIGGMLGGLFGK
ncbi:MAG: hypothetical protein IPP32_00860 [Bacteroidetes bacterium]|nr:hypothetical protein [Bacteroidota bacterium]